MSSQQAHVAQLFNDNALSMTQRIDAVTAELQWDQELVVEILNSCSDASDGDRCEHASPARFPLFHIFPFSFVWQVRWVK